jgi:hypothetical protein
MEILRGRGEACGAINFGKSSLKPRVQRVPPAPYLLVARGATRKNPVQPRVFAER